MSLLYLIGFLMFVYFVFEFVCECVESFYLYEVFMLVIYCGDYVCYNYYDVDLCMFGVCVCNMLIVWDL